MRKTSQRQAIRQALEAEARPMSPQELLQAAQPWAPGIGQATVYRAIKTGVEEGSLRAVELPGQATRYELADQACHHHHFECSKCRRVFCLEGCPGHMEPLVPEGFKLESHHLTLYGLCDACNPENG